MTYATSCSASGSMPLVGPIVRPFPAPGPLVRVAIEQLHSAQMRVSAGETMTDEDLRRLTTLPRPWDPASCSGHLRRELWGWLDEVAIWVNDQHLWALNRPGIPECWPAHPHIAHDLAVLACLRFLAGIGLVPAQVEEWHRFTLPAFLERLRDRLGDGCQPGRHQPPPRRERNDRHDADAQRGGRGQRFDHDTANVVGGRLA